MVTDFPLFLRLVERVAFITRLLLIINHLLQFFSELHQVLVLLQQFSECFLQLLLLVSVDLFPAA
jgi:hypothetical protein